MTALLSTTSSLAETELARVRRLTADTIRGLAMDAVQKANSGHPGMPMGMADAAVVLWTRFLKHNPADPLWADRDRFILSAGHGSILLYSLLHLSGYDLPLGQLPAFPATKPLATRAASGAVLDAIAPHLPALLGGSADLTPSNNTLPKGEHDLTRNDFRAC